MSADADLVVAREVDSVLLKLDLLPKLIGLRDE